MLPRWRSASAGPVWWSDGAPDLNRTMVASTPYATWFDDLSGT
jgi:hypothetical protein